MKIYNRFYDSIKRSPEDFLNTIRLVRDIATAHLRLSSLYSTAGKNKEADFHKTQANGWFDDMFRLNNSSSAPNDLDAVFPTKESFLRYLRDIQKINSLCVFQYEQEGKITCIKKKNSENLCHFRKLDSCSYHPTDDIVNNAYSAREDYS